MSCFKTDDAARYFSSTHKQWIPCLILAVNPEDGSVQINCKPGEWIPLSVQKQKLEIAGTTQSPTSGGYVRFEDAKEHGGYAGADPQSPSSGQTPSSGSSQRRKTVKDAAPSPEQMQKIRSILESKEEVRKAAADSFEKFDVNSDGLLDPAELNICLKALKVELGIPSIQSSQIQMLIAKFDDDGNGALDPEEFVEFFERLLIKSRQCFQEFKLHSEFFVEKQAGSPLELYDVVRALGEGAFGVAQLVKDKRSGVTRVLKTINKLKANMPPQELEQEIKSLRVLDHPHIIKLFEYYEDSVNIYLAMEAAEGGELLKVIEDLSGQGWRVSEAWSATVMQQVLEAMTYCHGRRLMHKDLKAENIMLLNSTDSKTHPHAVIIDLGLAEMFGSSSSRADVQEGTRHSRVSLIRTETMSQEEYESKLYQRISSKKVGGTPITMAPEVWRTYMGRGTFGLKCDVYSLGVVLFQLLTGELPFTYCTLDPMGWLRVIQDGPPMHLLESCSGEAKSLVCKMVAFNPADRPTARQALQDVWFTEKAKQVDVKLSDNQMLALQNFSKKTDLQKAVTLQIAAQLRAADVPKINAIFKKYDVDNTGCLERTELVAAFKDMNIAEEVAEKAADAIDLDKNGTVEYTEFVAACISMFHEGHEAYLWQIFTKLDKEGTGVLTRGDIEQLLKEGERHGLGFTPSKTEIDKYIEDMDKDSNGLIKFDEFVKYFQ